MYLKKTHLFNFHNFSYNLLNFFSKCCYGVFFFYVSKFVFLFFCHFLTVGKKYVVYLVKDIWLDLILSDLMYEFQIKWTLSGRLDLMYNELGLTQKTRHEDLSQFIAFFMFQPSNLTKGNLSFVLSYLILQNVIN